MDKLYLITRPISMDITWPIDIHDLRNYTAITVGVHHKDLESGFQYLRGIVLAREYYHLDTVSYIINQDGYPLWKQTAQLIEEYL